MNFPIIALKKWFKSHARDLPWRKTSDPYSIWVSEVMLQQTQVKTVLGYYERWIKRFPNIQALAHAPLEEIIKYWEGLGYYSRARNLQKGAQDILEKFSGTFPSTRENLLKIKGIGPYTVGALLSFAFHKKSTLIDGNIKRVLARFFALNHDFSIPKNHRILEKITQTILPDKEPWIFNEALMELGALICTPKNPNCKKCPISLRCLAKKESKTNQLPVKVRRKKQERLHRLVWIFQFGECLAISKQKNGVMQDLYEFPYEELKTNERMNIDINEKIKNLQIKNPLKVIPFPSFVHSFTHHHVTLYPYHIKLNETISVETFDWHSLDAIRSKPFSSGHRKVLHYLLRNETNHNLLFLKS